MTPEERAENLLLHGFKAARTDYKSDADIVKVTIAAAIRAAENDALERAALEFDEKATSAWNKYDAGHGKELRVESVAWARAAEVVRARKYKVA